jgi:TonB family protein
MFRRTLTDKLSGLKGLRIVEQQGVKEVLEELDRIMDRDRDNIDPASVDLAAIGKKLAANVLVRSTMQREGDHLSLSASLIDISDQKLLKGAAVDGPQANRQRLQADLARQIVQQLRGEPTDEEKAALEATMKEEEYQKQMAELARLLEKEKREKVRPEAAKPLVATAEPLNAQLAVAPAQPVVTEFSDAMIAPEMVSGPDPEYTTTALERNVEGVMVVRCVVSIKGYVNSCRVVRSVPFMDSAVVSALERRRYRPALLQGRPVAVYYTFKIRLTLPKVH